MIAFRFCSGATLLFAAWAVASPPTLAQIKTDGSVGPPRVLKGPDFRIDEQLGKRVGDNLFHSFEEFNIRTLGDGTIERATFRGAGDVANVISRVTGASPSEINGLLRSEVGKADFWFINPKGVAFGPNAQLDVPGSFHVGTADQLRFADGSMFSAVDPDASTLSVAPPEAFGFLGDRASDILVSGGRLDFADGKTVSLSSGRIDIINGEVHAPQGRVLLTTQTGAGEVRASSGRPSTPPSGTIEIADNAVVDTSGDGGGDIRVNTGRLLLDAGSLRANNAGDANAEFGVRIESDSAHLVNTSSLQSVAAGSGDAGRIDIKADELLIATSTFVTTSTSGKGAAGSINVEVGAGTIVDAGNGVVGLFSDARAGSEGPAGEISISARELHLRDGGEIRTSSFGRGNGGRITVEVEDRLQVTGRSVAREDRRGIPSKDNRQAGAGVRSSIRSQIEPGSAAKFGGDLRISAGLLQVADEAVIRSVTNTDGNAGDVAVEADQIVLRDGGQISSSTFAGGDSGDVSVKARDALTVRGTSVTTNPRSDLPNQNEPSGVFASTELETSDSGDGGDIHITTPTIVLSDFGKISSETFGGGASGTIEIDAPTQLTIASGAQITSATRGPGGAGHVEIKASEIRIGSGGRIDVSSSAEGEPGSITISGAKKVVITGDGRFPLTGVHSDIQMSSTAVSAGRIDVTADELHLLDGGEIRSTTFGWGRGGRIGVHVEERLLITGRDALNLAAGIRSNVEPSSQGDSGGDIDVRAGDLELGDGHIQSATRSDGTAGSVRVVAGRIKLVDGGQISSSQLGSGRGDGGEVEVVARDAITIAGQSTFINPVDNKPEPSGIFASLENKNSTSGTGGAIEVIAPRINLLNRGEISSETFARGIGGGILIAAGNRLTLSNAEITAVSTASREGGDAGSITIQNTGILELKERALIRTQAESADGGDILISVRELIDLVDSAITTEVGSERGGSGDGGNIRIDPRFLVLDHSAINASAALDSAGNITIVADNLIRSPGSDIKATGGPAGIDGRIVLQTVEADLTGDLAELPATFLVNERLFDQSCAARSGQPVSSLQRSGRGGRAQIPDAPLGAVFLADKLPEYASAVPDQPTDASQNAGNLDPVPALSMLDCK